MSWKGEQAATDAEPTPNAGGGRDPGCLLCAESPDPGWVLAYRDGDPDSEGLRETLLTLGNGYLATRGADPEARSDGIHYPGSYVAGFRNRLATTGGGSDDESIVNLPNWLPFTFRPAGGHWYAPHTVHLLHEHQLLDMRSGVYRRECLVVDGWQRRTRLRQRRLVSMADAHLAALETTIIPENWSGRVEVRSALDGDVVNSNTATSTGISGRHLTDVRTGTDGPETIWMTAQTTQSRQRVAFAARTRSSVPAELRTVAGPMEIGHELHAGLGRGDRLTVEKTVAVYTTRDRAVSEPLDNARQAVSWAGSFETLLREHEAAWRRLWSNFRLDVGATHPWQLPIRVHLFHLLQTLSPHSADLDAGVPARGLHGEGYQGNTFWDELIVFGFLNLRLPELSRALLSYRHRRLGQARRQATELGLPGARFPWQSGSSGRDESPRESRNPRTGACVPDHTGRQHHVNLALAYAVWRYWEATEDLTFLATYGLDMLVEAARFWAGLATYDPASDRYDIRGVMGPDEFHDGYPDRPGEGVDNCAYLNVLTAWVLGRACDAQTLVKQRHGALVEQDVRAGDEELARWDHIRRRLRVPFLDNGVIAQFEGYGDLAELDWAGYRARYGDLGNLAAILQAEGDSANRYRVSKQADVLMLLYLFSARELRGVLAELGYDFPPENIPATVDFYLARTTHGSTLSHVVHAWVLARTDRRRSGQMLGLALGTDLSDLNQGTTREGIHLGAITGTLDLLQRCYPGLQVRQDVLRLDPQLPEELHTIDLVLRYRDHPINLVIDHARVVVRSLAPAGPPITLEIKGTRHVLTPGAAVSMPLTS